jgi:hypothetical protein
MIRSMFAFVVFVIVSGISAQEPMTGDNPPAIVIQADAFGADSVIDSLQTLRFNLDKAQELLDSLTPVSNFTSAAHRATFYQAAAQLKRANVQLYSFMASVDPNNRYSWLQKAKQSKRQCDVAMGEYYKALPGEEVPVIEHHKLRLSSN